MGVRMRREAFSAKERPTLAETARMGHPASGCFVDNRAFGFASHDLVADSQKWLSH